MAGNDFTYTVGFLGNTKDLTEKINIFKGNLKSNPINLNMSLPDLDTGAAQKALNDIQAQGGSIQGVVAKTQQLRDAYGGVITQITGLVVKVKDVDGNIRTVNKNIENNVQAVGNNIKAYDTMGKKAQEWGNRAESMGQKEKQAIQGTADKLIQLIDAYKRLPVNTTIENYNRLEKEIHDVNAELDKQIANSKRSADGVRSWSTRMGDAIKQTIAYGTSIGLLRTAQQALNEAIKFTIDLNKELVNIQVLQAEGAQTDEEIMSLAKSFNSLAKEMGSTTLEVAKGSVEWLRQGKTIQETTELLKASTMLSKLGALSAAEATEYLTSTINSYKMSASEATSIVDKLVQVDNNSATSTRELATALRYVAATAAESGVSLEQLISYIGVMSSTTRINAESIGQSLKTIFARMQDIKAGAIDEDGLGINNVERALARIDVKLRENETTFRDFGAVLQDVSGKWSTLNDVEQANIAKAIAGVRQQNLFAVLMQNMGQALELQAMQYDANGLAVDRYGIYLDNIEAKQQQFKATLESLYMEEGFQDLIKDVIEFGTEILNLIKDLGGLKTVFTMLTGVTLAYAVSNIKVTTILKILQKILGKDLLVALTEAIFGTRSLTIATTAEAASVAGATTAWTALKTSITAFLATNAVGIIIMLATALIAVGVNSKTPLERIQKINEEIQETNNKISQLSSSVKTILELKDAYGELAEKTEKLSTEEEKRLTEIQNQLKEVIPNLAGSYDEYGNFIVANTEALNAETQAMIAQIAAEKELAKLKAEESAEKTGNALETQYLAVQMAERGRGMGGQVLTKYQQAKVIEDYRQALEASKASFMIMGKEAQQAFIDGISDENLRRIFENIFNAPGVEAGWKASADRLTAEAEAYFKSLGMEVPLPVVPKLDYTDAMGIAKQLEDIMSAWNTMQTALKGGKSPFEIDDKTLKTLGLAVEDFTILNGQWVLTTDKSNMVIEGFATLANTLKETNPEMADYYNKLFLVGDSSEFLEKRLKDTESQISAVASALKEESENQGISAETAEKLADSGLGDYFEVTGNKINFKNKALKDDITTTLSAEVVQNNITGVMENVEKGNYDVAIATLLKAKAEAIANEESTTAIDTMINEVKILHDLADANNDLAGSGGGGGGESGYQSMIDAVVEMLKYKAEQRKANLEAELDALEKEHDKAVKTLEDQRDAYDKLIDKKKESLQATKDAHEYQKSIDEKAGAVADIRKQIAALEYDTSLEGTQKKLELEDQLKEKTGDLEEEQWQHGIELQENALDAQKEAYDEAVDAKIEALDKQFEKEKEIIEKQIEAIDAYLSDTVALQAEAMRLIQEGTDAFWKSMEDWAIKTGNAIQGVINKMWELKGMGWSWEEIRGYFGFTGPIKHQGGIIEEHHNGEFAGNLKTNEVFAKLLKGEYVATEGQMTNFLSNTLPKLMSNSSYQGSAINRTGDISLSMPITVNGNLDKSVIPDIDAIANKVIRSVNDAMISRGYIRTVNQTIS